MIEFNIEQWVPRFLLEDKNGYAMAKAMETCLRYAARAIRQGVGIIIDVETMPEWRLDELAWELNILYDFNAGVETKRNWIHESIATYQLYGTPRAIYRFMDGLLNDVKVEEWWEYGGEPFHFRILSADLDGSMANYAKIRSFIQQLKNVRSVFDGIRANPAVAAATAYAGHVTQIVRHITIKIGV